jgi:choline dehydrogenase
VDTDTVVLSAGAFESPHLLMRSGIGPAEDLRRLGIPVVCDLPGVGRRFSDHPQVVLKWTPKAYPGGGNDSWISGCLNFRSTDGASSGDLQILPSNVAMSVLTGHPPANSEPRLPVLVSVMAPTPTGTMRLVSTDPRTPVGHRISLPVDRGGQGPAPRGRADGPRPGVEPGVRRDGRWPPGPRHRTADDDSLDRWIRERLGTSLHASGTAPMGPDDDPNSVVDQFGRVHGISGLRIADTSILPATPRRGPAGTGVLIGEMIAHSLRR